LALGFPVLIIPFALFFLIISPDSPRALLIAGKEEEAFQSLQFYQAIYLIIKKAFLLILSEIRGLDCHTEGHQTGIGPTECHSQKQWGRRRHPTIPSPHTAEAANVGHHPGPHGQWKIRSAIATGRICAHFCPLG
jgi:hypothetical protein